MIWVLGLVAIVAVAIFLLRQFDKIAGRGPKQVSDGLERSRRARDKMWGRK